MDTFRGGLTHTKHVKGKNLQRELISTRLHAPDAIDCTIPNGAGRNKKPHMDDNRILHPALTHV